MTRIEKRLLRRTLTLGLLLTLLVITADGAGLLEPLERYFYDLRARHFQYFTPPPTDRIVHLDIDDPTLKEVGWWPWPRTKLAEIVDEIHLAGAKVIGFDVLFPESQETRYEKALDGSFQAIEDDQNFTAAVKRAGNVLLPISAQLNEHDEQASSQSVKRLLEFAISMPPNLPAMLRSDSELPTIPSFAEAAKYSGVVDFLPDPDGTVRYVPLFVNYRGKLMPHMALAAFCATMDVNISDLKITAESVTIPLLNAPPIVIPLRAVDSVLFGRVGMFMDIPWVGKPGSKSLERMYDWPDHLEAKQHEPLQNIWAICQDLHNIQRNGRETDDAIKSANSNSSMPARNAYLAMPFADRTSSQRAEIVQASLKDFEEQGIPLLAASKPEDLSKDDAQYLASYQALQRSGQMNQKLTDQIQKYRAVLRSKLGGRYALIGWTATGKTDAYPTSIDPLASGVSMQGVVFNALMTRQFWQHTPWWVGAVITLLLGALSTLAVAMLSSGGAIFCTTALVGAYMALNGLFFFDYGNRIVPAAAPVIAPLLICFGVTVARFIYERRERARIAKRFSSYTDPKITNFVFENPEQAFFDGQVKEMSVVFTDLAGFTTISEKLQEKTVPLLNEYMSLMLPIIRENNGVWNKFLGDGIMFFYNAPDNNDRHAADAIRTVLQMQEAMIPFNEHLFARGLPKCTMRAGISTGMMIVGDAGSTDKKHGASDYTVLGDEVNLGARLESANKALGSRILMNRRAAELVDSEILLRPMGTIQVVGKTEGVMTYEAICLLTEATEQQKTLVHLSAQMVQHFRAASFDPCIEAAKKIEDAFGSSKYTQLYLRLAREYLISPPDHGFDGNIVLEEK